MFRRIVPLLIAVFLLAVYSPVTTSASAPTTRVVLLNQSHDFDTFLDSPEDAFETIFGSSRANGRLQIKLEFPRNIDTLVGSTVTVPVTLLGPGKTGFTGQLNGTLESVETSKGKAIYGYLYGILTKNAEQKYVDLSITYDPSTQKSWVMVSWGYANESRFSVIPFGSYHELVKPTVDTHASQNANRKDKQLNQGTPTIGIYEYPVTEEPAPRTSGSLDATCGGITYGVGGMSAYGPDNVKGGATWVYGGRVFSNTSSAWTVYECKYPSIGFATAPQAIGATSTITLPIGFSGGDPHFPEAQYFSGPYTVPVPYPSPFGGWDLTSFTFGGQQISVTKITSSGSAYPNGISHVWSGGDYAPDSDLDVDVWYDEQGERGWAGAAEFSWQKQTTSTGTVSHYAKVTYREPGPFTDLIWSFYKTRTWTVHMYPGA